MLAYYSYFLIRLVHDLTAYTPAKNGTFALRASVRGSSGARRSSARLDTVLRQLSRLSDSLGESYNNQSKSESLAEEEEPEESLCETESQPEVKTHTKSLCLGPKRRENKHWHNQSLATTSTEQRQFPGCLPLKNQHNLKVCPMSGPNISLRRQLLLGGLEEELV